MSCVGLQPHDVKGKRNDQADDVQGGRDGEHARAKPLHGKESKPAALIRRLFSGKAAKASGESWPRP
jgi:hypothetical protein